MNSTKLNNLNYFLYIFTILILSALICNFYWAILIKYYNNDDEKFVDLTIIFLILFSIIYIIYRIKIKIQEILISSLMAFFLFPVLWYVLPLKIERPYIGIIETDKENVIVNRNYCLSNCNALKEHLQNGFHEHKKFYSWKYAESLNYYRIDNYNCYNSHNLPIDNYYFNSFLMILELTFEYFPIIILSTFILFLYLKIKRKEIDYDKIGFTKTNFKHNKINALGIILFFLIFLYNILYISKL